MTNHDAFLRQSLYRLRRLAGGLTVRRRVRNSELALIALCAPFGALVGLATVALHELAAWLRVIDFNLAPGAHLSTGAGTDILRLAVVPAGGGLILGLLVLARRRFSTRSIVDPIEANAMFGGRMSLLDSLRLTVTTLIANGAGASLGMEAAYSQMGAGLLSSIAQVMRLRRADLRVFVAAGAGAAIAAAFNAPLAGAFYAYELVLGSYSPSALAQVAVACLSATMVMRETIGVAPIFALADPAIAVAQWEYPLLALFGLLAGGVGILTMRAVTWWESAMRALPTPDWLRPLIGGLVLSALAFPFPQVLGSGQGAIQSHFDGALALWPVAVLLAAKMAASAISIGSGFRGGLFSSALFIGCLLGALTVQIGALVFPALAEERVLYMVVGMGSVAAAIVGAPVTMVMLVLEVTGDFPVALGVLTGVVTAATLVRHTFGYSFATWRFHQRGMAIRGAHDVGWIDDLTVGRLMRTDAGTVGVGVPLLHLREMVPLGSRTRVFALDGQGRYAGVIDVAVIHDADLDDAAAGLVAGDLAEAADRFLLPSQNVRTALGRFADAEMEALPVVADAGERRMVGYLTEAHALRRYTEELERRRSDELGERDLFSLRSGG